MNMLVFTSASGQPIHIDSRKQPSNQNTDTIPTSRETMHNRQMIAEIRCDRWKEFKNKLGKHCLYETLLETTVSSIYTLSSTILIFVENLRR